MKFLHSTSNDPYLNVALEDHLLNGHEDVLLVCVNRPCVVIGKHQNPWRECDLAAMEADGVELVRRVSGGGAVYHDAGNLNISMVLPRSTYRRDDVFQLWIDVLAELGVEGVEANGPSSLVYKARKISGQAFCYRRERVLHHGTLLLNTDLEKMDRYLRRSEGFETHAVESVPAAVANLGLDQDDVVAALRERCDEAMSLPDGIDPTPFGHWDWVYGKTPRFTIGGELVERGRVVKGPVPDRIGSTFKLF